MSSCSTPPTAAGSLRATSGRSPCRSTSPSNSSAPTRTSWNSARPTADRRHTARQRSTPDPLPCKLQTECGNPPINTQGERPTMLHVLPEPPSYRQRALVQIEALIAQAEKNLARHYAAQPAKAKAQDRLQRDPPPWALLSRPRQFLLSEEFPPVTAGRH